MQDIQFAVDVWLLVFRLAELANLSSSPLPQNIFAESRSDCWTFGKVDLLIKTKIFLKNILKIFFKSYFF